MIKKRIIASLLSILSIGTMISVPAYAYTNTYNYTANPQTYTKQNSAHYTIHTAWDGWTGTACTDLGHTNGYTNSHKTSIYREYGLRASGSYLIYEDIESAAQRIVKTDIYRTVSSACYKRTHSSTLRYTSSSSSPIIDTLSTNVTKPT